MTRDALDPRSGTHLIVKVRVPRADIMWSADEHLTLSNENEQRLIDGYPSWFKLVLDGQIVGYEVAHQVPAAASLRASTVDRTVAQQEVLRFARLLADEIEKTSNARDALASERAKRDQVEASLKGTRMRAARDRKALKTVKNRVAHGVCPCCNRTFQQLARHMKTKHPDFVASSEEAKS